MSEPLTRWRIPIYRMNSSPVSAAKKFSPATESSSAAKGNLSREAEFLSVD